MTLSDKLLHLRAPVSIYKAKDTSSIVCCPVCRNTLTSSQEGYHCEVDGAFNIDVSGRPILITQALYKESSEEHVSGVNWLKSFFKQFPKVYYLIWHIFCPVLMVQNGPRKILKLLPPKGVVLDIGSGPERLGEEFINVDIFPFPEVDIVADAERLPFKDASIDGIVTETVLEHVPNPAKMVEEMERVLKRGGILYASVPFIHPYHASPDDFHRWTISGLKELCKEFEIIETGVRSGPWSAFLMFLAYWLGIVFSFGSRRLAPFLAHVFMLVLGPLKLLDLLFAQLPGAEAVAAVIYVVGKKK